MNLVIANAGTGQKIRATAGSQKLILSFYIVDGESYILLLSCYYAKPVFTIMNWLHTRFQGIWFLLFCHDCTWTIKVEFNISNAARWHWYWPGNELCWGMVVKLGLKWASLFLRVVKLCLRISSLTYKLELQREWQIWFLSISRSTSSYMAVESYTLIDDKSLRYCEML